MPFSLRGERGMVDTLDSSHVFNQTASLPYILLSSADLQVWFLKSSMHFFINHCYNHWPPERRISLRVEEKNYTEGIVLVTAGTTDCFLNIPTAE